MQLSPESIQILLWQKCVGLKQRGDSFLHAQSSLITHKNPFLFKRSLPSYCDKASLKSGHAALESEAELFSKSRQGFLFKSAMVVLVNTSVTFRCTSLQTLTMEQRGNCSQLTCWSMQALTAMGPSSASMTS